MAGPDLHRGGATFLGRSLWGPRCHHFSHSDVTTVGCRSGIRHPTTPAHGDPQAHCFAQADSDTGAFPNSHWFSHDSYRYAAAPAAPHTGAITRPAGRYDGAISNPDRTDARAAA